VLTWEHHTTHLSLFLSLNRFGLIILIFSFAIKAAHNLFVEPALNQFAAKIALVQTLIMFHHLNTVVVADVIVHFLTQVPWLSYTNL